MTTTGDLPGSNRLEITTEFGKLVCENDVLTVFKLPMSEREFCVVSQEGFGKLPVETSEYAVQPRPYPHAEVMNAFAAHILHGGPLTARGEEGINELTLSNAMYLSAWLDRPVELPFDEALYLKLLNQKRAASKHKEIKETTFDTDGSY